jgi:hypothetical protein
MVDVSHARDRFWNALPGFETRHFPESIRSTLRRFWAETAQMEHASIASFNRFSLQLLAVGAPPELLEASQRAGLDEIEHARMAFALASKYGSEPLGPDALDLRGDTLGPLDLASVAAATVEEGCVGETLAALEAEAAREISQAPALHAAWSVIAEDEARHAELAWSFVRWALESGSPEVRASVEAAFERSLRRLTEEPRLESPLDAELEAHGRLSARTRSALHERALDEVLRPTVAELLNRERSRSR